MEVRKNAINVQFIVTVALIVIGATLRLVPHVPNFAPVGAIALFGGTLLSWRLAVWLPLGVMMASDLILGFYPGIIYTWAGFLLVAVWGMVFHKRRFVARVTLGALGSSSIFFVVSNFGVWIASGMYAHTFSGLLLCYTLALPFLRATVVSDIVYSVILFSGYAFALWGARRLNWIKTNPKHDVAI